MRILRGLASLPGPGAARGPSPGRGCVLTLGVFDGVHLGHFMVLRKVMEQARSRGLEAAVVTFAGHPKEVLLGRSPATVTSLEHRLLLFERAGMETALVLEFTPELRQLAARDFLRQVLLKGLGARALVLGFDSKFGRDREGNAETLVPLLREAGVGLTVVSALRIGGRAVSSSAIREAVSLGELDRAAVMLGRPVSLLGTVVPGDGRGREIGFPTANLDLHHELRPPRGVYAALVLVRGELRSGVVNIGKRPTFGGDRTQVEVHLPGFQGSLYGEDLEVFFLGRLRGEVAFPDADALAERIHKDIAEARHWSEEASRSWRIPGRYLPIEGPGVEELVRKGTAAV
ncbi:MAG: riboflavin biosynthesis protein RibF [Planctomycetota bacterium]